MFFKALARTARGMLPSTLCYFLVETFFHALTNSILFIGDLSCGDNFARDKWRQKFRSPRQDPYLKASLMPKSILQTFWKVCPSRTAAKYWPMVDFKYLYLVFSSNGSISQYVDIVGVTGSIPVAPSIKIRYFR